MRPRAFSPPHSGDHVTQELVQRILEFARPVSYCDLIVGRTFRGVSIGIGATKVIQHGLQRIPEGWIVIRKYSSGDIFEAADPTEQTLSLRASTSVMFDLWVF